MSRISPPLTTSMTVPSTGSSFSLRVSVDLDDGALDDVAVVEVLDGAVDGGEEVLLRPDVVDRDLLKGRGGGGVGGHAVGCSGGTQIVDRVRFWCLWYR